MVSATEQIVNKLKGTSGKLDKGTAAQLPFAKMMTKTLGQVANVAVDIGLAWAGWNAAKFEQFAEVQKMMIDSGAVVYGTSDVFNELYETSMQAGITYKSFASVIANFGGTMVGIGGDTSKGSQAFIKMFKRVSIETDTLGDLGMSNVDLMNAYAGFIETQRLTGRLDKQLAGNGELLNENFKQLVLESGAVADLTADTRSEAMAKMLGALNMSHTAAGLKRMEELGLTDTTSVLRSLVKQISIFADNPATDFYSNLQSALSTAIGMFSANPNDFDIKQVMGNIDKKMVGIIDANMPGFWKAFNDNVIEAEENQGKVSESWLIDMIASAKKERLSGVPVGDMEAYHNILSANILIMQNYGKLKGKSLDEQAELMKEFYAASGASTVAMNDMEKMFLTAQEFITYPMQDMGEKLEFVTSLLGDGATWLNDLFNDYKKDDNTAVIKNNKINDTKTSSTSTSNVSASYVLDNLTELPVNPTEKDRPMLDKRLTSLTNSNIIYNTPGNISGSAFTIKKNQIAEEIRLTRLMIASLERENQINENIQFNRQAEIAMGYIN